MSILIKTKSFLNSLYYIKWNGVNTDTRCSGTGDKIQGFYVCLFGSWNQSSDSMSLSEYKLRPWAGTDGNALYQEFKNSQDTNDSYFPRRGQILTLWLPGIKLGTWALNPAAMWTLADWNSVCPWRDLSVHTTSGRNPGIVQIFCRPFKPLADPLSTGHLKSLECL